MENDNTLSHNNPKNIENILEEDFLDSMKKEVDVLRKRQEKTLALEKSIISRYMNFFNIEEEKYYGAMCAVAMHDIALVYGSDNTIIKAALEEANRICDTIRLQGLREKTCIILHSKVEKNINKNNNRGDLNRNKLFNDIKTLGKIVSDSYSNGKNMAEKNDLTMAISEAMDNDKITETEARQIRKIFTYYVMAEHIHEEYCDDTNYRHLQKTALEAYKGISNNSIKILLEYVGKDFLKANSNK